MIDFIQPLSVDESHKPFNLVVRWGGIKESYERIKNINDLFDYLELEPDFASKIFHPNDVSDALETKGDMATYYLITYDNDELKIVNQNRLIDIYKNWYYDIYLKHSEYQPLFALDDITISSSSNDECNNETQPVFYITGPYSDPSEYSMPTFYESPYLTYQEAKNGALTDTIDTQDNHAIYAATLVGHYEINQPEFIKD